MDFFFEIHKDIPREGPGSAKSTQMALNMIQGVEENITVLDIGCGPGEQTIALAKKLNGKILALDVHQPFIDKLNLKAIQEGVSDKIQTVNGSMFELDKHFEKESFDIIWSEGAIFIAGFEDGINEWKKYLKESGYLAVTELSWLKSNAPEEIKDYWNKEYSKMKRVDENILSIEKAGYKIIGTFTLPESAWWDGYYGPLQSRINMLKEEHSNDSEKMDRLRNTQEEIEMYRKYSEYYGYVFYIMQKI